MKRKLISFLITIVLIMGILPLTVTAAEAPFYPGSTNQSDGGT